MAQVLAVVRGGALSLFVGVLLFGLDVVIGSAEPGALVFVVGAVAGMVIGLTDRGPTALTVIGSVSVGLVAIGSGIATGFGALEYAMALGTVFAVVWVRDGERHLAGFSRGLVWLCVAVVLLGLVVLPLILDGGTLGHDEAAYAVKARQWLEGTPGSGWLPHRGTGMSVYGYVVLAMGGSEAGLRTIGLIGAVGLLAGVWALGRRLSTAIAGAMAVFGMLAGPSFLFRSTEYLSDVPAAALLVWCMVVIWSELGVRDLPTYRLALVGPLAVIAFYLRYQSLLSLILIGLVSVALWWPKLRKRPGPALAVLAVGIVGLIPHFVHSLDIYDSPLGILLDTSGSAIRAYVGEGLVDYGSQFWWVLAGWTGPIAVIGAAMGVVLGRRDRGLQRRYVFLLVPAFAQVLALGLISHGDPRFVFFPVALFMVAGAIGIEMWLGHERNRRRGLALGLAVLVAGSLALSATYARDRVGGRTASTEPVGLAAEAMGAEAAPGTCGVMTTFAPQVTFYSGCLTRLFTPGVDPIAAVELLTGDSRFMLLVEDGVRQPAGAELDGLLALTTGGPVPVDGARRDAVYYRFAD